MRPRRCCASLPRWIAIPAFNIEIMLSISAAPIGGHHLIDVLAGVAVGAASLAIAHTFAKAGLRDRPPVVLVMHSASRNLNRTTLAAHARELVRHRPRHQAFSTISCRRSAIDVQLRAAPDRSGTRRIAIALRGSHDRGLHCRYVDQRVGNWKWHQGDRFTAALTSRHADLADTSRGGETQRCRGRLRVEERV
jgi:hypothetical protein